MGGRIMSEGKFEVYRAHKMLDWLEGEATQWAENLVEEHFGCEEISELTKDQIEEVIAVAEDLDEHYGDMLSMGMYNIVRYWESENEEYIL